MHKKKDYGSIVNNIIGTKFDMCFKNKKIIIRQLFSKYVVLLIFLVGVVILDYNQICNQTLYLKIIIIFRQ